MEEGVRGSPVSSFVPKKWFSEQIEINEEGKSYDWA